MILINCRECKVETRNFGGGLCEKCYHAKRRAIKEHQIELCSACNQMKNNVTNGVCRKCYMNLRNNAPKKVKSPNCLSCGESFEHVIRIAKNLCRTCYRLAVIENKDGSCKKCGGDLLKGTSDGLCINCKPVGYYTKLKREKVKKLNKEHITDEIISEIKLILVKVKHKMVSDIDLFVILNLHLTCYGHKASLDTFTPEHQGYLMVKELKKLYDEYEK